MASRHAKDLRLFRTHLHPVPLGAAALTALVHFGRHRAPFPQATNSERRGSNADGPHATSPEKHGFRLGILNPGGEGEKYERRLTGPERHL